MIRRMLSTGMLVVMGLALAAGAQTENPFHWSGKVAPENVVEIKNLNGRIEAEPASGDQVEVTADKSGSNADQVRIVVARVGCADRNSIGTLRWRNCSTNPCRSRSLPTVACKKVPSLLRTVRMSLSIASEVAWPASAIR